MPNIFNIPFDSGMHQDVDPGNAKEGTLSRILNGRVPRLGGIVKRLSTESVPITVEPSGASQAMPSSRPNACARAQGRDMLAVGGRVYERDAGTVPSWVESGRASSYLPRKAHFLSLDETAKTAAAGGIAEPPQVAALGNFLCVAYAETEASDPQVVVLLLDPSGVRRFTARIQGSGGTGRQSPRVVAVGSVFVITYAYEYAVDTLVAMRTLDPSTSTLSAEITLPLRTDNHDAYDAAPWDSTSFLMVYRNTGTTMRTRRISLAGATLNSFDTTVPNQVTLNVRVYGTPSEGVWVVFRDATTANGQLFVVNSSFSATTAVSLFGTDVKYFGMTRRSSTSVWLVHTDLLALGAGAAQECVSALTLDTAGLLGSTPVRYWNMRLASNPFDGATGETKVSVWLMPNGQTPRTHPSTGSQTLTERFWLVTLATDPSSSTLGWANVELSSELRPDRSAQSTVTSPPYLPLGPVAQRGERFYFVSTCLLGDRPAIYMHEYEDASTRRGAWRQLFSVPGGSAVAGGHLNEPPSDRRNDGADVTVARGFENGWVRGPWVHSISFPAGAFPLGSYTYGVVYEYVDADGRRRRSPVDFGSVTVAGAPSGITFVVTSPFVTEREVSSSQQRGTIAIYIAAAAGSATLYRATPNTNATLGLQPPEFTSPDQLVSVTLTAAPSTTNEQIYTAGGEVPNMPSPSHRYAISADSRVHVAGLWEPTITEVSKFIPANEPPQFTNLDQFRVRWPFAVSAIAELDGLTLALGVDGLATVPSIWPDDKGNPGAPEPTYLSSTGLRDDDAVMSILRIPRGVLFQGDRGIFLVPRGGDEPEFIGAPLQADTFTVYAVAACSEVADANAPSSRLVAFAIIDTSGTRWVAMLDQDTLQWVSLDTCDQNLELLGTWGNDLVQVPLNVNAAAIAKSATSRSSSFVLSSESNWCRPFGLLGQGYIRRAQLAVTVLDVGAAGIVLQFARDGGAYSTLNTIIPSVTGLQRLEWQLPLDQISTAVRFRVSVGSISTILHGLAIEVDQLPGIATLPAGARA